MEGDYIMSVEDSYFRWNGSGAETGAGTVFTTVTGNLKFTDDDIRAVYIDWDDGTSNTKLESNYQWVELTEPTGNINPEHTYTASGTFSPVVQTVNSKGFFSKYYSSEATNTDISPFAQLGVMEDITIVDSEATGIMKMENRTVKSGIDNSIFDVEGPKDVFVAVAPTLSTTELAYLCETGSAATGSVQIDVKCVMNFGVRDGDGPTIVTDTGGERIIKTLPVVLSGAYLTNNVIGLRNIIASGAADKTALESGSQISQILEVKYKNPKYMGSNTTAYTENEVYNRFKVFFLAYSSTLGKYIPITYISAGEPIKKASDTLRNVTLDFSQSRAAASNVELASYRYDIGKSWFQSANAWSTGSATTFSDKTKQTGVTKDTAYTYMTQPSGMTTNATYAVFTTSLPWDTNAASATIEDQLVLDDYGRFYPQYHLPRVSVEPSSSASYISTITDNKPEVFRITPAVSWATTSDGSTAASAANSRIYPTKLIDFDTNASKSKTYTAAAFNNTSGASGLVDLAAMNGMTFYDVTATAREANEYLLLMFDKKTNKIFLNMSNYADKMQSALGSAPSWGIAGIYYLALHDKGTPKQNAYWQPVEFNDTTAVTKEYRDTNNYKYTNMKAPLSKSGYISFDMPLDWGSLSLSGACGGVYDSTAAPTTTGSYDYGLMTVAFDGFRESASGAGAGIGDFAVYEITAGDVPATSGQSDVDIGSFKYIFIPTAPPDETGTAYWVSADGTPGYASGALAINVGASGSYTGDTNEYSVSGITEGLIRRVNIYDIIDGFSKVYKASGAADSSHLYNVDAHEGDDSSDYWNNTYCVNSGTTIGTEIATAWADEKYLLKIVLSGGVGANSVYPEIWNIFDATRGYTGVVQEIDDTAYNLNSIAITSDISITRAGNYFQAITRKGKVFIARVGTPIQTIGFDSVALGDSSSAAAFEDFGDPSKLYGHLHMVRKIQADNVRVYWDEPQKDGTFVRFWGIITKVSETLGVGGPNAIVSYNFNMIVEEVALLDDNYILMTDIFPLGSTEDARNYT
tara:strand:- start:115 stop:3210 length:3096 start_codon:yes stop_codon:yes gene_type:complete